MAFQINKPQTFQLKVAQAKVKKQAKDGPLFFILPPLLVAAVIAFCYAFPSPAIAQAEPPGKVADLSDPSPQAAEGFIDREAGSPADGSSFVADEEPQMVDGEYPDEEPYEDLDEEPGPSADTAEEAAGDNGADDAGNEGE